MERGRFSSLGRPRIFLNPDGFENERMNRGDSGQYQQEQQQHSTSWPPEEEENSPIPEEHSRNLARSSSPGKTDDEKERLKTLLARTAAALKLEQNVNERLLSRLGYGAAVRSPAGSTHGYESGTRSGRSRSRSPPLPVQLSTRLQEERAQPPYPEMHHRSEERSSAVLNENYRGAGDLRSVSSLQLRGSVQEPGFRYSQVERPPEEHPALPHSGYFASNSGGRLMSHLETSSFNYIPEEDRRESRSGYERLSKAGQHHFESRERLSEPHFESQDLLVEPRHFGGNFEPEALQYGYSEGPGQLSQPRGGFRIREQLLPEPPYGSEMEPIEYFGSREWLPQEPGPQLHYESHEPLSQEPRYRYGEGDEPGPRYHYGLNERFSEVQQQQYHTDIPIESFDDYPGGRYMALNQLGASSLQLPQEVHAGNPYVSGEQMPYNLGFGSRDPYGMAPSFEGNYYPSEEHSAVPWLANPTPGLQIEVPNLSRNMGVDILYGAEEGRHSASDSNGEYKTSGNYMPKRKKGNKQRAKEWQLKPNDARHKIYEKKELKPGDARFKLNAKRNFHVSVPNQGGDSRSDREAVDYSNLALGEVAGNERRGRRRRRRR